MTKKYRITAILTFTDLSTKLLAFFFLPYDEPVNIFKGLGFRLIYNDSGSNALLDFSGYSGTKTTILVNAFCMVISLSAILFNRIKAAKAIKALTYLSLFLIYSFTFNSLTGIIPDIPISNYMLSITRFTGGLLIGITFLILTKDRIFSVLWAVFLSAVLGNFINNFFPPFAIIDFICLDKFNRFPWAGIFNLADVFAAAAFVGFGLYSGIYFLRLSLRKINTNRSNVI